MTDLVAVAEWMAEQGLHLEPSTLDYLDGGFITLYLFQETQWEGEPNTIGSWERLEGDLKKALFYTHEQIPFYVVMEEKRPRVA